MKMNNLKNLRKEAVKNKNSGITLIALVVTIIVLLILAGISISMLSGDNSILSRAGKARESQRGGVIEDEVTLAIEENEIISNLNKTKSNNDRKKTKLELVEDLLAKGYLKEDEAKKLENEDTIVIGNKTIDFSKLPGTVSIELTIVGTKVNESTPPNPDSNIFEYLTGTIDTGYVIKDKNNGNEFVWVPVDANQKITLKIKSTKEDISNIKLYDPLGVEINLGTIEGKNYNNTNITPTVNGQYKAEVTTENGTDIKTLVVRSLYAKDVFNDYRTTETTLSNYNDPETQEISNIKNSVNTNGGFYIARYEAGATTTRKTGNIKATVESIKNENGIPTSKANEMPYINITQSQAKGLAETMYPEKSYICTLTTGAAWDRTLGWLINTNNKSFRDILSDSSDWGNYNNLSFDVESTAKYSTNGGKTYTAVSDSYTKPAVTAGVLLTTGAAPTRNVSNNILDLAGNVLEWTTERYESKYVNRGGHYSTRGYFSPCYFRNGYGDETFMSNGIGFRAALYL